MSQSTSPSRRDFLAAAAATTAAAQSESAGQSAHSMSAHTLDGFSIARQHIIARDVPTPDFFEGMLLGNGDIGVCITVRPDALGLHLGKSDSWDIRVSEEHDSRVLPFAEVRKLWEQASEEAKRQGHPEMTSMENKIPVLRDYAELVGESYRKSWPRPWPCGIVWIHWDATHFRIVKQTLDPSNGLFQLNLLADSKPVRIRAFVNSAAGHVCVWSDVACDFHSVAYDPNIDEEARLPEPRVTTESTDGTATFSGFQAFPATAPTASNSHQKLSEQDRSFALHALLQGDWKTAATSSHNAELLGSGPQVLRLDLTLITTRDHKDNVAFARSEAQRLSVSPPDSLLRSSETYWTDYWSKSAVRLADQELERWWYHNQYWLACCLRPGKVAPGLFGNWTSGKIGTAWHGDYHMNYNTQQVFWSVFSSNHVDLHLPYIDLVENLMPISTKYAREKFGLPGAYFPHSAYPVPSQVVAYPVPPWGYEICETPWVVQSLWWHYLYTRDKSILERVYPMLKAAAEFVTAYVEKDDTGKYHVRPTVSPENWGCTVDYRLNQDCIMDLALIDFLLAAVEEASTVLDVDAAERDKWAHVRTNLTTYPTAETPQGTIWVDVLNAPAGWIYNIPVTLAPVFPGERVGLGSDRNTLELAHRSAQTMRLEGGNDIVYQPLILARLGMLDLEWFKREVRYCMLPNGIINDRVRQVGGRYRDSTDFDFMMRMGVWTENLSLPVVLNECFLQSYSGVLHFFPNSTNLGPAHFHQFRAAGAFLVSASWNGQTVSSIQLLSEKGNKVQFLNPWKGRRIAVKRQANSATVEITQHGEILEFPTEPNQTYSILSS